MAEDQRQGGTGRVACERARTLQTQGTEPENQEGKDLSDRTSRKPHRPSGLHRCRGLDNILGGGLPAWHLYLVDGDPGTGKTTLGIQFLSEGVRVGEAVLYVTLSESKKELRQVARSHGWDLQGIGIFELLPMEESLNVEEQYTVLYPGEVELSETIRSILARIEQVQPSRVVGLTSPVDLFPTCEATPGSSPTCSRTFSRTP